MAGKGGGAWKVAYADFVTAMMALFMVLWILSQDAEILKATSRYFKNPFNSPLDRSTSVIDEGSSQTLDELLNVETNSSAMDMALLHEVAREFYRMLDLDSSEEDESPVVINVSDDGLKVVIYDQVAHPFFKKSSDEFTDWGAMIIRNLAWITESYKLQVRVNAFSSKPEGDRARERDLFDLTTQRANSTRKALIYYALPPERIDQVSGYADRKPIEGLEATDPKNERLELSLSMPML